ncbi:MAG: 2-keto-4-pentenoate hydratase [Legionellales bacterium]|nr:2-keto-4-pentenoate hydratase [Legionellales bacterium]
MKLATRKTHSRDGALCVVNQSLSQALDISDQIPTLQCLLDHWSTLAPLAEQAYHQLNQGKAVDAFVFKSEQFAAPLPRAYQWADGSAYVTHVALVRQARGATMPENFWTDPLMYQGGSDHFLGPCDDIVADSEAYGIDFEAEISVITDDVPMGLDPSQAGCHIKLITLVNDVSLRNLIADELSKGFGFFQSKPASSFAPVAVTVDELGDAWDGKRVHLPLFSYLNQQLFGQPNAGIDMTFDFPTLIAHAAKTRLLTAGTVIGSGTVSNQDHSRGSSCIAERRMLEILEHQQAQTPFMRYGDRVRIEMLDAQGQTIFGCIDQQVVPSA